MCDLDSIFTALSDKQRRYALCCLLMHHTVALADLAEFVCEKETEQELSTLSAEKVQETYFSLYHKHIPVLEDANLVRYNQEEDLVARTSQVPNALKKAHERVSTLQNIVT